jgi:2-dehydro-3-deoxy-D-arabinonate dehydratase
VPEPELTLAVSSSARIFGYTIGNDMSSRSIEGENPLYLPQAKVYQRCCALGPCLLVAEGELSPETSISLEVRREDKVIVSASVALARMKRRLPELVGFLFRDNIFPDGCYLMTGTAVVPPPDFTLRRGDRIAIHIEPLGTLVNKVG